MYTDKVLDKMLTGGCLMVGVVALAVLLVGWPKYSIWQREQAGRAELAQAEWNKRIAVEEARAKADSARLEAEAEIERAKGVAEANRIIGDSLSDNDEYLRYLWISKVEEGTNRQVIYVPTEAGLPILEANRLAPQPVGEQR